jgi:hypothetical protein
MTTATTASDVRTAADRGVVPSVATMSAPKPECDPPYVVDATTGKKHWKLECM